MARHANPLTPKVVPAFRNQGELDAYNKAHKTTLKVGDVDPRPGRKGKRIRRFRDVLTPEQKAARQAQEAMAKMARAAETAIGAALAASPTFGSLAQNRAAALFIRNEARTLADEAQYDAKRAALLKRIEALDAMHEMAADVLDNIDGATAGIRKVGDVLAGEVSAKMLRGDGTPVSPARVEALLAEYLSDAERNFLANIADPFAQYRKDAEADTADADDAYDTADADDAYDTADADDAYDADDAE